MPWMPTVPPGGLRTVEPSPKDVALNVPPMVAATLVNLRSPPVPATTESDAAYRMELDAKK